MQYIQGKTLNPRQPDFSVAKRVAYLPGELKNTELADHIDLDLSRVFELIFDPERDSARQRSRLKVRDLVRGHKDTDFSSGLYCKGFFDTVERVGDRLKVLETLDVVLYAVATGAWTADSIVSYGYSSWWDCIALMTRSSTLNFWRMRRPISTWVP